MSQQQCTKFDDKVTKCIFVTYNNESKAIVCFIRKQRRSRLVKIFYFVEDVVQHLVSCTKEIYIHSLDIYNILLPLFNGAHPIVKKVDAHVEARNQPIQIHDQQFDDVHVDDAIDEER